MPPHCKPSVIPMFGQNTSHSSVPAKIAKAISRIGGQGRPSGRRDSAQSLTAANTMAASRSLGTMLGFMMILAFSMLSSGAAYAARISPPTRHASSSEPPYPFAAFVREASRRFSVPEHWIRAVMHVESGAKQRARSSKGAMGLMQIMPGTWTELRVRHGLGADPYDPHDNILAGTAYIRELHNRYGTPGFLAAYNAGPGRYERQATGRPLPAETQAYVAALTPVTGVGAIGGKVAPVAKSFPSARSPLFVVRIASNLTAGQSSSGVRSGRPSSVRTVFDLSALIPQSGNLFVHRTSQVRSQ